MKYLVLFIFLSLALAGYGFSDRIADPKTDNGHSTEWAPEEDDDPKTCKTSGCTVGDDSSKNLSNEDIQDLLFKLSQENFDEESNTLDTLLFHNKSFSSYIKKNGSTEAGIVWATLLEEAAQKNSFKIFIKVTKQNGEIAFQNEEEVEIAGKFKLEHKDLAGKKPLVFEGRSKRVGLNHIWTRF
jgi:hypothetical protein